MSGARRTGSISAGPEVTPLLYIGAQGGHIGRRLGARGQSRFRSVGRARKGRRNLANGLSNGADLFPSSAVGELQGQIRFANRQVCLIAHFDQSLTGKRMTAFHPERTRGCGWRALSKLGYPDANGSR